MDDDERRRVSLKRLAKAHEWRFKLKAGDEIDARDSVLLATAERAREAPAVSAGLGTWREARVVQVAEDNIVVRFLGWGDKLDTTIDRLSVEIQPRHTFTIPWREKLKEIQAARTRTDNRSDSVEIARNSLDRGWRGNIEAIRKHREGTARLLRAHSCDPWVSIGERGASQWDMHSAGSGDTGRVNAGSMRFSVMGNSMARRGDAMDVDKSDAERVADGASGSQSRLSERNAQNVSTPRSAMRRVALIGSSGGGAAAQGQFDGRSLLLLAEKELRQANVELAAVQFVSCVEPLDAASPDAAATLWISDGERGLVEAARGTLSEVNVAARREDAKIADGLRAGSEGKQTTSDAGPSPETTTAAAVRRLHGLVAISCDVAGVNSQAITAARDCRAPIVGTGGSSLGTAMAMGCLLVGSSGGSVATTNKSKVVSYTAGLAGHWGLEYDAAVELTQTLASAATFGGCLPAYVGVMVAVSIGAGPGVGADGAVAPEWVVRLWRALPVVAAAVTARQVSSLGDMATAAGILAGSLCCEDTLAALAAGALAGYLCSKITGYALDLGIPATALSLYATATSGIAAGMIVALLLPVLEMIWLTVASTDAFLTNLPNSSIQALVGAIMGCLMCYGSKIGWYHRVFLPVIVLELAGGGGSLWGAIDLCALCMIAAGLCAAHYVRPSTPTDVALARRGLVFNVCFGDFIEAAYPFMERCRWCNASAYVGSAISGAIVAVGGISSSAYLPLPLAFAACETPGWLMAATFGAFLPAFCIGLCRPAGKQGPQDPFPVKSVDNQRR